MQEFTQVMADMARTLRAQPDLQTTLQATVELAARLLQGRGEVSISLVRKDSVETAASTGERATLADRLQYELGEGPCVDAAWRHETFQIEDLEHDENYPQWSPRVAKQTGFHGVVAYQLFTSADTLGALNVYTENRRPYEAVDRAEGLWLATHAAIALQGARTEEQLSSALLTRNMIGQAQGILMERFQLSAARAFEFLTRTSQTSNTKLTVIAQRVIDTRADVDR
jgi:transcriptional regulator with GAF, ATPase, and Fis domain